MPFIAELKRRNVIRMAGSWSMYCARSPVETLKAAEQAGENGIEIDTELFHAKSLLRLGRVDDVRALAAGNDTPGKRYLAILLAVHDGELARARSLTSALHARER